MRNLRISRYADLISKSVAVNMGNDLDGRFGPGVRQNDDMHLILKSIADREVIQECSLEAFRGHGDQLGLRLDERGRIRIAKGGRRAAQSSVNNVLPTF